MCREKRSRALICLSEQIDVFLAAALYTICAIAGIFLLIRPIEKENPREHLKSLVFSPRFEKSEGVLHFGNVMLAGFMLATKNEASVQMQPTVRSSCSILLSVVGNATTRTIQLRACPV